MICECRGGRLTKAEIGVWRGGEAVGGTGRGLGGSCRPGLGSWHPFQAPLSTTGSLLSCGFEPGEKPDASGLGLAVSGKLLVIQEEGSWMRPDHSVVRMRR